VTTEQGIACTIQVADCLPVLFAAPEGRGVGAAHAGWRGAGGRGAGSDHRDAVRRGRLPARGSEGRGSAPGSGRPRFQVGADVVEAFGAGRRGDTRLDGGAGGSASSEDRVERFVPESPGKWLANLPLLARDRLRAAGVTAVSGGAWCTVSEPSRFFSFRRDRVTGRMGAVIWLDARR
jgi:copper oxidase (laccase) domain-containing protein